MVADRSFGWLPDSRDPRDYPLGRTGELATDITRADSALGMLELHREVSRIRDQGRTSSCVGQAVAAAVEVRRALDGLPRILLAELAAYWGARGLYGFAGEDAGAYIRGGFKWAHRVGLPAQSEWPMDDDTYWARGPKSKINRRPHAAAETHGMAQAGGAYERVATGPGVVERTLDCLQLGCPVVGGFGVTSRFMEGNGTIPAPRPGERREGGHAIALLAFDRRGERVAFANSWGSDYGERGYGWLAAEWLQDRETGDLWACRAKEAA